MVAKTTIKLCLAISALFIFGCANQLPPPGGPIDRIPPEIIYSFPENGTLNYKKKYIELKFSEYVDKRSVQDAIFISPAVDGQIEFDWSGRSLEIIFPSELKEDVTYIITVGTGAADLNNRNKMAQAYTIFFSTGSKIDKGSIEGKVYNDKPEGVMIFAYKNNSDTLNPSFIKPDYVSQVGKDGFYKLSGLADGEYRVFAVRDQFNDFLYNIGEDEYGAPHKIVELSETDTLIKGVNFFLVRDDTTKPRLYSAKMTDQNHILLEFSEELDTSAINSINYSIIDSTLDKNINVKYAMQSRGRNNHVILSISDSVFIDNIYYVLIRNIKDLKGNSNKFDFSRIVVSDRRDTSAPKLMSISPGNRFSQMDFEKPEIVFFFDDSIDSVTAKKGFWAADTSKNALKQSIRFINDATVILKIEETLKPVSDYIIKVDFNYIIDAAGNRKDSVFTYSFRTFNGLDFTGVSGYVRAKMLQRDKVKVVLQSAAKDSRIFLSDLTHDYFYNFVRIPPGSYLIWAFEDKNDNNKYDNGKPYPFQLSEKFTFYPDTLKLRARWPVGDVIIDMEY